MLPSIAVVDNGSKMNLVGHDIGLSQSVKVSNLYHIMKVPANTRVYF